MAEWLWRCVKAAVRKIVGSNPTLVNIIYHVFHSGSFFSDEYHYFCVVLRHGMCCDWSNPIFFVLVGRNPFRQR